jgi:hypothetical protein
VNDLWCEAFEQALRRKQASEWDSLNLRALPTQNRDVDYQLALLLKYNDETTEEERERRLGVWRARAVDRATTTFNEETSDDIELGSRLVKGSMRPA